jgi:predicted RNase H-like HicB family nuclease
MAYTATYRKISSGYMGQIVEWPQVITEGKDLEDCRQSLKDALREMMAAYREDRQEIPGNVLYESMG